TEHLTRRRRARLFFYLHEVGTPVAEQRLERTAAVRRFCDLAFVPHAVRGQREDLEAALALPRDVDRLAEPRLPPALRNGDGGFQPTGRERAQLAAVGWLEIGVAEN